MMNDDIWHFMQQHLGYTDEELEIFRSNPKNVDIMSKAPGLMKKTIVAVLLSLSWVTGAAAQGLSGPSSINDPTF